MAEIELPKIMWEYKLFDPEEKKKGKYKHHVAFQSEQCKDILVHAFQGEEDDCRMVDRELYNMKGFKQRCKMVKLDYARDTDASDARLKEKLQKACGKCWCVALAVTNSKKRKPGYELVEVVEEKKKPRVQEEEEPLALGVEEAKELELEIPEADDMWMSTEPLENWKFHTQVLIQLILNKKRWNEMVPPPEQRQNWVIWDYKLEWRTKRPSGMDDFIDAFTRKGYIFTDEARESGGPGYNVSWAHRDPALRAPVAVSLAVVS